MANAKDKAAEEVEREELIPRPADCEEAEESSFEDESFTVIVNEATGEIEQRLPLTGKVEVADPDDPEGTIEVTPAQMRDLSIRRTIEHNREQLDRLTGDEPASGPAALQALATVQREAEAAGEELSASEALARAEERIAESSAGGDSITALRSEGVDVKLSIEKVR